MNKTVESQLTAPALKSDKDMIERRLFSLADEANTRRPGPLDNPETHMKRMPDDLRYVRKKRIGRHRVYYIGDYSKCRYNAVFIKAFKKSGVKDDDDRVFQKKLESLVSTPAERVLSPNILSK